MLEEGRSTRGRDPVYGRRPRTFSAVVITLGLFLQVAQPLVAQNQGDDWPFFKGRAQRSGEKYFFQAPGYPAIQWEYESGSPGWPASLAPALAHGLVYFVDGNGFLHAVDAATGSLSWKQWAHDTVNPGSLSPVVAGSVVLSTASYVDAAGKVIEVLRAFDAPSGRPLWWHNVSTSGSAHDTSVAGANGIAYLAGESVTALDLSTGQTRWSFEGEHETFGSPIFVDGLLFVGSTRNTLRALDAASGELRWSFSPRDVGFTGPASAMSQPAAAQGLVFLGEGGFEGLGFAGESATLYALDQMTGRKVWYFESAGQGFSTPAVADGRIIIGAVDTLHAFDASSGSPLWSQSTPRGLFVSPAVSNGVAYVWHDGEIEALNATNGKFRWSVGAPSVYAPELAYGTLFGLAQGGLVALDVSAPQPDIRLNVTVPSERVEPPPHSTPAPSPQRHRFDPTLNGFAFSNAQFLSEVGSPAAPTIEQLQDAIRRYPQLAGDTLAGTLTWALYAVGISIATSSGYCFGMTKTALDYYAGDIEARNLTIGEARIDVVNAHAAQALNLSVILSQFRLSLPLPHSNAEQLFGIQAATSKGPVMVSLFRGENRSREPSGMQSHSVLVYGSRNTSEGIVLLAYDPNHSSQTSEIYLQRDGTIFGNRLNSSFDRIGIVPASPEETFLQVRSFLGAAEVLVARSPVDFGVIASDGRRLGVIDGKVEHGFPGVYLPAGEKKVLVLAEPRTTYRVVVIGTGSGSYTLERHSMAKTGASETFSGTISRGEKVEYVVQGGVLQKLAAGGPRLEFGPVLILGIVAAVGAGGLYYRQRKKKDAESKAHAAQAISAKEGMDSEQTPGVACNTCGAKWPTGTRFCGECGKQL